MSTASDNKVLSFLNFYFQKGANLIKGAVAQRGDGQSITNYSDADMENVRQAYNKENPNNPIEKAELAKDLQYFKAAHKNDGVTLAGNTFGNNDKVTQWDLFKALQQEEARLAWKKADGDRNFADGKHPIHASTDSNKPLNHRTIEVKP